MKVQYVNAILNAVKEVFVSMLGMSVSFENPINKTTLHPSYEICSIIKMRGDLSCWIVFSYPEEIAKFVASEMLDEDFSDINDQAVDAICEIANMVTGVADTDLEMENVSYSLPTIVIDKEKIKYSNDTFVFSMPCLLDSGRFEVDISLFEDRSTSK